MVKTGFRIREVYESDLDAICRLEEQTFSVPWTRRDYEKLLGSETAVFLAASYKDPASGGPEQTAGYGCIQLAADEGDLLSIAVSPGLRGSGCGGLLLRALLREAGQRGARRIFLEVRESNVQAIRMYERAGFTEISIRKNYYTKPAENAILMRWCREENRDVRNGI